MLRRRVAVCSLALVAHTAKLPPPDGLSMHSFAQASTRPLLLAAHSPQSWAHLPAHLCTSAANLAFSLRLTSMVATLTPTTLTVH